VKAQSLWDYVMSDAKVLKAYNDLVQEEKRLEKRQKRVERRFEEDDILPLGLNGSE